MKKKKRHTSNREKRINLIGSSLAGIILLILWVTCLKNLFSGNLFGYKNYYGQPVGTLLLLSVLVIVTPIACYAAWKSYKGELPTKRKGKLRKDQYSDNEHNNWL